MSKSTKIFYLADERAFKLRKNGKYSLRIGGELVRASLVRGATPKEIKWYEDLKKFYYESGRRIAKKYLKWTNARKN